MIPSLEGWPTKAKEAPSPHEVRLTPLDTNPVLHCPGDKCFRDKYLHSLGDKCFQCLSDLRQELKLASELESDL